MCHTRVRRMFRQKLRRLPVLGSVYAIIAALGLVVLAVGVIGVAAVYTTNKHVRELEEVANRAFFAEHANSLIYAVVMDSRGIYMSADAADRATYGAGVMKFLAELDANMTAWKQYVAPDDRSNFARAQARAQEFIRFRTELVRLGNEVGQTAAREWGDNDANGPTGKRSTATSSCWPRRTTPSWRSCARGSTSIRSGSSCWRPRPWPAAFFSPFC